MSVNQQSPPPPGFNNVTFDLPLHDTPPPKYSERNWFINHSHGLSSLTTIDQLDVTQEVKTFSDLCGGDTSSKFQILNKTGQKVFTAKGDAQCCCRNFDLKIYDNQDEEVLVLYRSTRCQSCTCLERLEVSASGSSCGYLEQIWSFWWQKFKICDSTGKIIFLIKGPYNVYSYNSRVSFKILTPDGETEVGQIAKQWTGSFARQAHFGVSFPMDLDVNIKATLIGACFLIDFRHFERLSNNVGASSSSY